MVNNREYFRVFMAALLHNADGFMRGKGLHLGMYFNPYMKNGRKQWYLEAMDLDGHRLVSFNLEELYDKFIDKGTEGDVYSALEYIASKFLQHENEDKKEREATIEQAASFNPGMLIPQLARKKSDGNEEDKLYKISYNDMEILFRYMSTPGDDITKHPLVTTEFMEEARAGIYPKADILSLALRNWKKMAHMDEVKLEKLPMPGITGFSPLYQVRSQVQGSAILIFDRLALMEISMLFGRGMFLFPTAGGGLICCPYGACSLQELYFAKDYLDNAHAEEGVITDCIYSWR